MHNSLFRDETSVYPPDQLNFLCELVFAEHGAMVAKRDPPIAKVFEDGPAPAIDSCLQQAITLGSLLPRVYASHHLCLTDEAPRKLNPKSMIPQAGVESRSGD
jgi:hypothetical protein